MKQLLLVVTAQSTPNPLKTKHLKGVLLGRPFSFAVSVANFFPRFPLKTFEIGHKAAELLLHQKASVLPE